MAIEHRKLPIAGIQFHPESIMTLSGGTGQVIINNVVKAYTKNNISFTWGKVALL